MCAHICDEDEKLPVVLYLLRMKIKMKSAKISKTCAESRLL